jgi:hypothetical protein
LIDFMPLRGKNSDVIRLVRGDRGEVAMRMQLILRFGYGAVVPWVTRLRHAWCGLIFRSKATASTARPSPQRSGRVIPTWPLPLHPSCASQTLG